MNESSQSISSSGTVPATQPALSLAHLSPASREQDIPLSFGQERLFFLQRLEPESWHYNVRVFLKITGDLDIYALERAITEIVRRHEVLRTRLVIAESSPVQVIEPAVALILPVVDLQQSPDLQQEIQSIAAREGCAPFDLSCGPLLRTKLLRTGRDKHVLLLTMHHAVSDAWSMGLFAGELKSLYAAFHESQPPGLPELAIQYADYALWQRRWMQGELCERQLRYWKTQLAGVPQSTLPTASRPAMQTYKGNACAFTIPAELSQSLKNLARHEAVTLFMSALAVFYVLLHRYSDQTDIVVGTPISGRNHEKLESLIGFFLNMLPLRIEVNRELTFWQLLKQVRRVSLEAYANQDVPFERIVDELQPERDLSRSPLFQVFFAVQHASGTQWTLPGLEIEHLQREAHASKFDLSLGLRTNGEQINAGINYVADLFDDVFIARMTEHFLTVLKQIVSNPEVRIGEFDLLSAEEKQQIKAAQGAQVPVPGLCAHELVERVATRLPTAPAVVDGKQTLNYAELDRRANQLARYLRRLGVGPEQIVAVCLQPSADLVVALLGVLKAGGAYVPLDPSYPRERLVYMLEDCGASVLLTQDVSPVDFSARSGARLDLDEAWKEISREHSHAVEKVSLPENLAYMIYTSGSTGKPKGVEICHSALVNFLLAMERETGIGESDVLMVVTSLSFDIAGLEIYLPLSVGARIRILDRESTTDGRRLREELNQGVTFMQATPSTWLLLLEAGWTPGSQLKVLCGGEALVSALAQRLVRDSTWLWNLYGPTETTIWSLIEQIRTPDQPITIGRPIANTEAHVLSTAMMPVPAGVEGELYLGGDGVARGYHQRPELTAEKFLPNPFASHPGARLYRTGDRVKRVVNGKIEFLGRMDNQIKIRGYRVEPGEIEAILEQQSGVDQAIVVAADHGSGQRSLVAYVIGKPDLDTADLRLRLRNILPAYMVPSAIVLVDQFPLTPNAKVDRRALQNAGAITQPQNTREISRPVTEVEQVVARIVSESLGLHEVSLEANFFDLGGDSLLAMRLVARIQGVLQVEPSMRALFTTDTLRSFAATIGIQLLECKSG